MPNANVVLINNKIIISGELNFHTVITIYAECMSFLRKHSALEFDFSQVTASNSAGLALVIELIKYGKQNNVAVSISHLSQDLLSLSKASGLQQLISSN